MRRSVLGLPVRRRRRWGLGGWGVEKGGVFPSVALLTPTPKEKDAAVNYSTYLTLLVATLSSKLPGEFHPQTADPARPPLEEDLRPALDRILDLAAAFAADGPSPEATL